MSTAPFDVPRRRLANDTADQQSEFRRPVLTIAILAAAALVIGATTALWAHVGDEIFLDRLVTAFASCL